MCFLIPLYMCPHALICVLIPLHTCPHTPICELVPLEVSAYPYICVLILVLIPIRQLEDSVEELRHKPLYVSSYPYMCPHTPIYVSFYPCIIQKRQLERSVEELQRLSADKDLTVSRLEQALDAHLTGICSLRPHTLVTEGLIH